MESAAANAPRPDLPHLVREVREILAAFRRGEKPAAELQQAANMLFGNLERGVSLAALPANPDNTLPAQIYQLALRAWKSMGISFEKGSHGEQAAGVTRRVRLYTMCLENLFEVEEFLKQFETALQKANGSPEESGK